MDHHDVTDDEVAAVEQTARALLNDRIAIIRKLAGSKQQLTQIRTQLADTEREYGADYVAAQRAGWTEDELNQLGFGSPTRRPPGRPARNGRRRARTAQATSNISAATTINSSPS